MTDLPIFRQDLLAKVFDGDLTLVSAFQQLVRYVTEAADNASAGASVANTVSTASLLTLSPVSGWAGARVLTQGTGVSLADDGSRVTVSLDSLTPKIDGGFPVTFLVTADTNLILPVIGTVATLADIQAAISTGTVTSFNTRVGAVTLTSGDVTGALGYTPTSITGFTGAQTPTQITAALNVFSSTLKGLAPLSGGGTTNFLRADGTWAAPPGTTGTVTSVSGVTANGVSFSIANPTTTPAITVTLGAITPSSVAASGTVTGSNLSGTNTGDQTITLTGDVTGSGTGSFAATIGANKVTFAKFVAATQKSLVGATAAGNFGEITLGTGVAISAGVLSATGTGGTVTSITLTQPAAGLTITGSGVAITSTGSPTFALANDLAGVEGLSTNGIAVRTATDTWTTRTIGGTANRITITNGDGISGAPAIDIASSYVGQSTITTLGTIATGTWQGTAVAAGFGGTGLATYAVGDILYASASTTLSKLPDVATGNALISGGVTTAPSWGKIGLTTHVSGTLPVANGGTGVTASTGTVAVVLSTSPTLVTPVLGAATFTSLAGTGAITTTAGQVGIGTASTLTDLDVRGHAGLFKTVGSDGANLYIGDANFANANYVKAPGLQAMFNAAVGVACDLGMFIYNGTARTEIARAVYLSGIEPAVDNTYYLGKNSSTSPKAWKGVILKDTASGTYYRVQITSGALTIVSL